jgi:superfamily II DNA or RNA helicase/HKD family nuclease/diadenosine tetraphosphate (Ap4A) HIT family hydrolase
MTEEVCPFCYPEEHAQFYNGETVVGLWDKFPVSPGHALIVPRRHVPDWFNATAQEQVELTRAIAVAKAAIESRYTPDAYNIGINVGRAAGQTVFHLHVHVIPRYHGDVADPRGGVRNVIASNGNYVVNDDGEEPVSSIVRGGTDDPLLTHLVGRLDTARSVSVATAFTLESGVKLIEEHLRDVLERRGSVRFLTGDYLGATEPVALHRLLDLQGDVQLRVYECSGSSFHPKAYIFTAEDGSGTAYIGSSNLSATALTHGIEWNYKVVTSRDASGFSDAVKAFEELWNHPNVKLLDREWIEAYDARRTPPVPALVGMAPEPLAAPPAPHGVQLEALAALERTRQEGNTAGLVVLATGLGKTWLSAFDTDRGDYQRILFIAHREEILSQAMRTFRTIRPRASLGYYTGTEKTPEADVLFASIQTLGRIQHLNRFDPHHFDYIVVDEFHHASAPTYSRVIAYFEPKFLLGLTATPERTDGGDLLPLCGNNLVYRCDVAEGIRRTLLCPFSYYGVPDEVDYTNIPWRNNRFDETALTEAVATQKRSQNALEHLQRYGKKRTIAFCVSQRHADYMARFFNEHGVRAASVHSGEHSAPRAHSLERLEAGDLDVVCAVDMFNEGVDLPNVDTILMLRPTESRIVWLQQFGRGLRHRPDKTLHVIDYIGNHRVFLTKARALFDLGTSDREVAFALDKLDRDEMTLPPGCSVTYDLEAKDILRSLLRTTAAGDQLREYYHDFKELNGARPQAVQAFEDGYNPRATRRSGEGSWFEFVKNENDLSADEVEVREQIGGFLEQLEVTPMTKSYKMVTLLAMLGEQVFPGSIPIDRLVERFGEIARRYAALRQELGTTLDDSTELKRLVERNPIAAWSGGDGTGGNAYFAYDGIEFRTLFTLPDRIQTTAQDMARELVEWRLTEYLQRNPPSRGVDQFVCRVSHSNGTPIIFLPDRTRLAGIPEGWQEIAVNGELYQANFVKVALNVVTEPGSNDNVLPTILRNWFGPMAGTAGRSDSVIFEREGNRYTMAPARIDADAQAGPRLWHTYRRPEAIEALGLKLTGWENQAGIVQRPQQLYFFVTLDKGSMPEEHKYEDKFLSPVDFQWQSQNRNKQDSELGQQIRFQREKGIAVHLFVRSVAKVGGQTKPFYYCGELEFDRWEGEKPITVWWKMKNSVPERLWKELKVPTP